MKKIILMVSFLFVLIGLVACDKEDLPEDWVDLELDTPIEVYNYLYTSMDNALKKETAEIVFYETLNEVDSEEIVLLSKANEIIYSNKDEVNLAYYQGKMYYSDSFSKFTTVSSKEYLSVVINKMYEIEFNHFLFCDNINFIESATGFTLEADAYIAPHLYSLDLETNLEHEMVSFTITSSVPSFTRSYTFTVNSTITSAMVAPAVFLPTATDMTESWDLLFEISAFIYAYSQKEEVKMNYYETTQENNFLVPENTYNMKSEKAYITREDGYDYFVNDKLYTHSDAEMTDFYKNVYTDAKYNGIKSVVLRDIFWLISDVNDVVFTKNIVDNKTVYSCSKFEVEIIDSKLANIFTEEEFGEDTLYKKYQYFDEATIVSEPANFRIDDYISDQECYDISEASSAYHTAKSVMHNQYLYDGGNPDQTDYAVAINSFSVSLVAEAPAVGEMLYNLIYIHATPTTVNGEGQILAVYFHSSTGKYKIYEENSIEKYLKLQ